MFKASGARRSRSANVSKRKADREDRSKAASINTDGSDQSRSCTIRDISAGGARISVTSQYGIPDQVLLICRAENLFALAAIAWRRENELGLRFVKRGTEQSLPQMRAAQVRFLEEQRAREAAEAEAVSAFEAANRQQRIMGWCRMLDLDPRFYNHADAIKESFKRRAKEVHPDQGGSVEAFQELSDAYNALIAEAEGAAPPLAPAG